MPTFGIIAEGKTDFPVLLHILSGAAGRDMSNDVISLPEDRSQDDGGWHYVIQFCESSNLIKFVGDIDFLIVQIDSDVSPRFGVAHNDIQGAPKDAHTLVADIKYNLQQRIQARLKPETWEYLQDKLLFAVTVDKVECWLLPLHTDDIAVAGSTTKCGRRLGELLPEGVKKNQQLYAKLSQGYRQPNVLREKGGLNPSLALFMSELERVEWERG